jgi:RimJ/RimL family protein N-acetyltransferase
MSWVLEGDPDLERFTLLPSNPDGQFLAGWLGRYEQGWDDGSCAGFAVRSADDGRVLGFGAFVRLELDHRQGEVGYAVSPAARGRGVASRTVALLTRWGFDVLELERIELRIDPANGASVRVAERAGYRLDGVLRNLHFKEGLRTDAGVWSRLRSD